MTVNTERVALGIAALRSGDYQQARGALCKDGGYCCLGVFCEVALANGLEGVDVETTTEAMYAADYSIKDVPGKSYDREKGYLPRAVAEWYGFKVSPSSKVADPLLTVSEDDFQVTATALNDSRQWSFGQIADAFEATFMTAEVAA